MTLNKASTGANVITLDPNIGTNPNDDILYLGTNYSVYRLDNPANAKAGSITWQRVGGDELPNNAVRDLDINTSTGILSVGLNGRGVWQFQIRNLVAGRVFTDVDGDGLVPPIAGETLDTPLAGVVVTLRDTVSNSVVATTTSDAAGRYQFISVPAGKYTVAAVPAPGIQVTTAGVPEFTVGLDPATVVLSEAPAVPASRSFPNSTSASTALARFLVLSLTTLTRTRRAMPARSACPASPFTSTPTTTASWTAAS